MGRAKTSGLPSNGKAPSAQVERIGLESAAKPLKAILPQFIDGCCSNCYYNHFNSVCSLGNGTIKSLRWKKSDMSLLHPSYKRIDQESTPKVQMSLQNETSARAPQQASDLRIKSSASAPKPYMLTGPPAKRRKGFTCAETKEQQENLPVPLINPDHPSMFHILGNLSLPYPKRFELDECHQKVAYALQKDLQALQTRDLSELRKTVHSTDEALETLELLESKAWAQHTSQQPSAQYLVKASGTLQLSLIHCLNQPSIKSDGILGNETADWSNGCLSSVMGSTTGQENTLKIDYIHRRDENSEGIHDYPDEVLASHEMCTQSIWESSEAKVMMVYGKKVQQRMLNKGTDKYSILPLWGETNGINVNGISIFLAHETNYRNADPAYKFRRVVVFPTHPQPLFYQKLSNDVLQTQDAVLLIAMTMATTASITPYPAYFQNKRFLKFLPNNLKSVVTLLSSHLRL